MIMVLFKNYYTSFVKLQIIVFAYRSLGWNGLLFTKSIKIVTVCSSFMKIHLITFSWCCRNISLRLKVVTFNSERF